MSTADVRQKVFRVPGSIVISVGLSWDFIGAEPVDLDLSAVCFTKEGQFIDVVFFNHLFPQGTDEEAIRSQFLVDPDLLPYMFLSGDSTIGGEEENQMPGIALAARRRKYQLQHRNKKRLISAAENIFNRLYEEEELNDVQQAMNEMPYYNGEGGGGRGHRELSDEVLTFVMHKMPAEAEVIFLSVSSYTGADFTVLPHARLVVHNETTNERVGTIELKAATGNGTASLAAMLVRVPAEPAGAESDALGPIALLDDWDLREVNVRTFGYTFVDVLPVMMDVLGVPKTSRLDALQNLPDYSLVKANDVEHGQLPLSDVRFGVGWDGEHDVDAFLVLLDENNNYVDHIYPKQGKLRSSVVRHMARHSGDALSGMDTAGDEEFIDLMTYRVPADVRTIVVGATYMESYDKIRAHQKKGESDKRSIYDIPNLYLRLQNRTLERPFSMEVDRWNVYRTAKENRTEEVGADGETKGPKKVKRTYHASDRTTQPVRTIILGMMLKKGTMPFETLFPDGRRLDQHFRKPPKDGNGPAATVNRSVTLDTSQEVSALGGGNATVLEADLEAEVPLFEFVPIHQYVPVDPRKGFSTVVPFLQSVAGYLWGSDGGANGTGANSAATTPRSAHGATAGARQHQPSQLATQRGAGGHVLDRQHNFAGWDPTTAIAVGGRRARGEAYSEIWESSAAEQHMTELFAVEVRFLEVTVLEPQLPDRFKCHGEAWVYGQSTPIRFDTHASAFDNKPFKTPFLVNRNGMFWDPQNPAAAGSFLVHQYDRIRIMLYEYAAFGVADLELLEMTPLWQGDRKEQSQPVEQLVTLQGGGPLSKAEVRIRVTRVPVKSVMHKLQREADRDNRRRARKTQQDVTEVNERHNASYNPCSVM